MALTLSEGEIKKRLIRLRNLENLHKVQLKRNIKLLAERKELRERVRILERRDKEKGAIIAGLKLQIEELKRMIFGRRKKKANPTEEDGDGEDSKDGNAPRKKADRTPDSYRRPVPKDEEVTQEGHHGVDLCPDCKTPLEDLETKVFYEEDIVLPTAGKPMRAALKRTIERGWCPSCKKWVSAFPLPPTQVMIGENARIYICYLSILLRLSFEQIRMLLKTTYHFGLSDGEISKILEQESVRLRPEYEALNDRIRLQKGVHYDETGWRVQKEKEGHHAWVMTGTETPEAVFVCGKSRGKGVAEDLKGNAAHIGISDDYGAYRNLFTKHQLCFAHPQRKFRDLADSPSLDERGQEQSKKTYEAFSLLYRDLREVLAQPFDLSKRKEALPSFLSRLDEVAEQNAVDPKKLATLKESLRKNRESYFVCLLEDGIPPDNNKAERSLRHLVLKRKTSFGSKTEEGARTTSVLASVLLSLFWSKPKDFFGEYAKLRGV